MGIIAKSNEGCDVTVVGCDFTTTTGSGVELCIGDMIIDGSFTGATTTFGVLIRSCSSVGFCFSSGRNELKECCCLRLLSLWISIGDDRRDPAINGIFGFRGGNCLRGTTGGGCRGVGGVGGSSRR
jgi:hypothetical protein